MNSLSAELIKDEVEATGCKCPLLLFCSESLSVTVPLLLGLWLLEGPQERI